MTAQTTLAPRAPTQAPAFKVLDWRPIVKGALRGFAKIELPSGMILHDVTICTAENGPWASPPGKPMVGRDGTQLRDQKGKFRYSPVVDFTSKELRDKFSAAVVEALAQAHPEALNDP